MSLGVPVIYHLGS